MGSRPLPRTALLALLPSLSGSGAHPCRYQLSEQPSRKRTTWSAPAPPAAAERVREGLPFDMSLPSTLMDREPWGRLSASLAALLLCWAGGGPSVESLAWTLYLAWCMQAALESVVLPRRAEFVSTGIRKIEWPLISSLLRGSVGGRAAACRKHAPTTACSALGPCLPQPRCPTRCQSSELDRLPSQRGSDHRRELRRVVAVLRP